MTGTDENLINCYLLLKAISNYAYMRTCITAAIIELIYKPQEELNNLFHAYCVSRRGNPIPQILSEINEIVQTKTLQDDQRTAQIINHQNSYLALSN